MNWDTVAVNSTTTHLSFWWTIMTFRWWLLSQLVFSYDILWLTVTNFKPGEVVLRSRCRAEKYTKLFCSLLQFWWWQGENKTAQIKTKCKPALRCELRTLPLECLKREQLQRKQAEQHTGQGVKCLQDRAPAHVWNSKTKRTRKWRHELERAPRGLPHPSASSGKQACMWLVHRDYQAQVRSMDALNADQSSTTPLGVGISESTAIAHLRTSEQHQTWWNSKALL